MNEASPESNHISDSFNESTDMAPSDINNDLELNIVGLNTFRRALADMLAEKEAEIEKLQNERPDPLAPLLEQNNFAFRAAELYGSVETLGKLYLVLYNDKQNKGA